MRDCCQRNGDRSEGCQKAHPNAKRSCQQFAQFVGRFGWHTICRYLYIYCAYMHVVYVHVLKYVYNTNGMHYPYFVCVVCEPTEASVEQIKRDLEETKKLLREKDNALTKLQQSYDEKIKQLELKEKTLEEKERGLDDEVNDITRQVCLIFVYFFFFESKELKDRSELLIRERDDVRKQKEHWQYLVDEQKQRAEMLRKHQEDLDKRHQEVLDLHRGVTEERKKLHDEKKRFLNERQKWEKERHKLWKRDSGSIQELAAKQKALANAASLAASNSIPMSSPVIAGPSSKPVSGITKSRLSAVANQPLDTLLMMGGSLKDVMSMSTLLAAAETYSEYP
ncbi:hypothetical protein RFI_19858 [Reticulomyxa filosa]|uniref:Uncharacterized protein n=1 Tax=Reticulomyxa filosa TaxID=46433 RepID=X6MUH9_RETFI|nr:hypothetical protein RFI_19858 [Reticulomyxa filosa]|eukprot:ETO17464.1 hypothetical protein RFI_19858 [Reticulomyxa filosa]